jgi:peptidoglycan/xylan/chitin deacetylase (PgdA/CDA1 family)
LVGERRDTLLPFLFHGLFRDRAEVASNLADPQQGVTVDVFRRFIAHFKWAGYVFVSPEDVLAGLTPGRRYAMITFDDGYYSNRLAVPVLAEFGVPAVFFISANHVRDGKGFWWDILYRHRTRQGASPAALAAEVGGLKRKRNDEIEAYLVSQFGPEALCPVGETDRPFTPAELRAFARERHVFIGNHTADHAILTNYSEDGVRQQIAGAQSTIAEMTGVTPVSIAYPNGNYGGPVLRATREAGIRFGITVDAGKNHLPINLAGDEALTLRRSVVDGYGNIDGQCEACRADFSVYAYAKTQRSRLARERTRAVQA